MPLYYARVIIEQVAEVEIEAENEKEVKCKIWKMDFNEERTESEEATTILEFHAENEKTST